MAAMNWPVARIWLARHTLGPFTPQSWLVRWIDEGLAEEKRLEVALDRLHRELADTQREIAEIQRELERHPGGEGGDHTSRPSHTAEWAPGRAKQIDEDDYTKHRNLPTMPGGGGNYPRLGTRQDRAVARRKENRGEF